MSNADYYEFITCETVDNVKHAELSSVDYDTPVYETPTYKVVPTIALTISGEPVVKYGVFSKNTNVMEADAHQFVTARSWCKALTEALAKSEDRLESEAFDDLPGLTTEIH